MDFFQGEDGNVIDDAFRRNAAVPGIND